MVNNQGQMGRHHVFGEVVFIIGLVILYAVGGWRLPVGVFLVAWAHNCMRH